MPREITTYGNIVGGKLIVSYRERFLECLKTFSDNTKVEVTVKKQYRKRSVNQNAFYWSVVINEMIKGWYDTTGEEINSNEAHEILKLKCNSKEVVNDDTGEVFTFGGSTKVLTTIEFEEYQESCRRFLAEWFGCDIPLPNEQSELRF